MADSHARYLHEQLTTAQGKYTYFLLAVAASAIALAVNRTSNGALAISQVPLGLAVLCWGLSFYFGCRQLTYVAATLRANVALVSVQDGSYPGLPPHRDIREAAADGAREAAESNAEEANRNAKRQFRFLVAGAACYIAWHVLTMALRTPDVASQLPAWLG